MCDSTGMTHEGGRRENGEGEEVRCERAMGEGEKVCGEDESVRGKEWWV